MILSDGAIWGDADDIFKYIWTKIDVNLAVESNNTFS